MKKYLFGIIALLLAFGFSSFKVIHRSSDIFHYIGTTYSVSSVQNNANWLSLPFSCETNINHYPCSIEIEEGHLDENGNLIHVQIFTTFSSPAYVTNVTDHTGIFTVLVGNGIVNRDED